MRQVDERPDDYVITQFSRYGMPVGTLRVSTAEHAFHLIEGRLPEEFEIHRHGKLLRRSDVFNAAVTEGMAPERANRRPFDFQKALEDRAEDR